MEITITGKRHPIISRPKTSSGGDWKVDGKWKYFHFGADIPSSEKDHIRRHVRVTLTREETLDFIKHVQELMATET